MDSRSDVFSMGVVPYETLTGQRPFEGSSGAALISAILRDEPRPMRKLRPEVPAAVEAIVDRALEKDPAVRYPNAAALRADLTSALAKLTRPSDSAWRRPAVLAPVALALVAAAAFGVWQINQVRQARWARLEAIPEIERMNLSGRTMHAVRLARAAEPYAPEDIARVRQGWLEFTIATEPAGAQTEMKNYQDMSGEWEPVGPTPVRVRLPFAYYRVRVTKPVYKRFYDYDKTALDARVESVEDDSPYWRKERVSYAAAYGNQRIPAYLFVPKNAKPPYQTVVFFPSAYARLVPSSGSLDLTMFEFIVRSGRALLYPVY